MELPLDLLLSRDLAKSNQRIDERDQSLSSSHELKYSSNGCAFAANEEVQFAHAPMSIRSIVPPEPAFRQFFMAPSASARSLTLSLSPAGSVSWSRIYHASSGNSEKGWFES